MQINKIKIYDDIIKNPYILESNPNNEIDIAVWCDGCNDWVTDVCISQDDSIFCQNCKEKLITVISKND